MAGSWADVITLRREVSWWWERNCACLPDCFFLPLRVSHSHSSSIHPLYPQLSLTFVSLPPYILQLAYELGQFQSRHQRPIGTTALGRFLSNQLYLHRLQPIYAFNIVAGLDQSGTYLDFSYNYPTFWLWSDRTMLWCTVRCIQAVDRCIPMMWLAHSIESMLLAAEEDRYTGLLPFDPINSATVDAQFR